MESKFPSTIWTISRFCLIIGFFNILCTSSNDYPLLLRFLVILSNKFPSYKPFQGLRGPTHRIFTFNYEVMKKLSFKDEVMTKILAKKVIPDNQGVMLEISLQQVLGFDLETRIENK